MIWHSVGWPTLYTSTEAKEKVSKRKIIRVKNESVRKIIRKGKKEIYSDRRTERRQF